MGNSGCHSRRGDGGVDHDTSLHVGKGSWVRSPGVSSSVGCCAYFSTQRTSGPLLRSFGSVLISPIQADASSVQYASIRFTWVTAGLKIHGRLAYAYDAIYGHVRSGSCPSEFKQQSIRKRILAVQTGLGLSGFFADRKVGPVLNSPRFLHLVTAVIVGFIHAGPQDWLATASITYSGTRCPLRESIYYGKDASMTQYQ